MDHSKRVNVTDSKVIIIGGGKREARGQKPASVRVHRAAWAERNRLNSLLLRGLARQRHILSPDHHVDGVRNRVGRSHQANV